MNLNEFIKCSAEWFESWFRFISSKILARELIITGNFSFPTLLRVGESPSHYIIDFTGAQNIFKPKEYQIKRPERTEKVRNTSSFINPGPPTNGDALALFTVGGLDNGCSDLTFATKFDREKFRKHINVPLNKSRLQADFEATIPLKIIKAADRTLLRNIDLIRSDGLQIFFRRVSTTIVVKKNPTQAELVDWLSWRSLSELNATAGRDIIGLNIGYGVSQETFAVNLLSLTQQNVSEAIIYPDLLRTRKKGVAKRGG